MTVNTTDGTLFQRENTPGGGVYTTIAQCMNIKPPERKRKKTETAIHDQSAPVVKYGAEESMTSEIELAFDNGLAAHQQLYTDYAAKTAINYRIVYTDAGARADTFNATIESIVGSDLNAEGTEAQTATVVFGLSAAPTIVW